MLLISILSAVIVGDSHLTSPYFGKNLHSHLKAKGVQTEVYAACGSSPVHWTKGRHKGLCGSVYINREGRSSNILPVTKLSRIIERTKVDAIIVELGDNLLGYIPGGEGAAKSQIKEMALQITVSGKKCIWVAPTWPSSGSFGGKTEFKSQRLLQLITEATKGLCAVIDSRALLKDLGPILPGDGVHLNSTSYRVWAERLAGELTK